MLSIKLTERTKALTVGETKASQDKSKLLKSLSIGVVLREQAGTGLALDPSEAIEIRGGMMTGLAEPNTYSGLANNARYAPFARVTEAASERRRTHGVRFSALGVIAVFLVFSGVTVVLAKGQAGIAEQYGISRESLLGFAWALQGLLALIGFVLAIRWLRS